MPENHAETHAAKPSTTPTVKPPKMIASKALGRSLKLLSVVFPSFNFSDGTPARCWRSFAGVSI